MSIPLPCFGLLLRHKTDRQATAIKVKPGTDRLHEPGHPWLPAESAASYHSSLKGPKQLGFHISSVYTLEGRHKTGNEAGTDGHLLYTSLTTLPSGTTRNAIDRPQSHDIRARSWSLPLSNSRQQPEQPTQSKLRLPEKVCWAARGRLSLGVSNSPDNGNTTGNPQQVDGRQGWATRIIQERNIGKLVSMLCIFISTSESEMRHFTDKSV